MADIKRRAEEYKSENGNEKITTKDLLFYIIARLDDIEKHNTSQDSKIESNSVKINIFWIILPIAITIAGIIGTLI